MRIAKELNVNLHLLGYRTDIAELLKIANVYAFPSYREGLSVALMEAMASGLPLIASKIRGNVDLVKDGINGYLVEPNDVCVWGEKIQYLKDNNSEQKIMRKNNQNDMKKYDKNVVKKQLYSIYKEQGIF